MLQYILRRLILIPLTLFGIMLVNFVVIQFAPGGPVEQAIAQFSGLNVSTTASVSTAESMGPSDQSAYMGASGLDPEFIEEINKHFGFDKPPHERFALMLWNYMRLDFGTSYFQDRSVLEIVLERLPVSLALGLSSMFLIYSISIPLGIAKAVRDGAPFDIWTSAAVFTAYAIPQFLFAIILVVFFAGGEWLNWFPMRNLLSDSFEELGFFGRVFDVLWHIALPVIALTMGGFATLTMLTKNCFLEEVSKQFVMTARAKGLTPKRVLFGHVFRNAMLIVISGFPAAFVGIIFTGAFLIEVIFSLDGIGLLGYEAVVVRDYPILFATLFCFSLLALVMQLIGDLVYVLVDPRIDFEKRVT
ncbi:MAG: microcin C ABC transporter permease YejB [Gammaproteobacteria bacterium]|nr:microcin C ABC transporter permease YejB [Gammaproteobacteria bacterium]MYD79084.1 microcin C ABC transporter permease YejB [Gammaproteobacteria bacterium]